MKISLVVAGGIIVGLACTSLLLAWQVHIEHARGNAEARAYRQRVVDFSRLEKACAPAPFDTPHSLNEGRRQTSPANNSSANSESAATRTKPMQLSRNPVDSAAARERVERQTRLNLWQLYGPLFNRLGLPPSQAGEMLNTLTSARMTGVSWVGADGTHNAAASVDQVSNAILAADSRIKALLGEQKFRDYTQYSQTLDERFRVNQLGSELDAAGMTLTPAQKEDLVAAMFEERQQMEPAPAFAKPITLDDLETRLAWDEKFEQRMSERVASILSSEQQSYFAAQLESRAKTRRTMVAAERRDLVAGNSDGLWYPSWF